MPVTNEELNKDNASVSETPGKAVNQRVSRSSFEPLPRIDDRQTFRFVQRKVTIMSSQSPFTVSKKKLKPWKRKVSSRTFIALTLKSLTRRRDLSTVLLLICPSSKCDCHRIHIYSSRSHKHLGSAKLTIEEADLLESHRNLDNYSVAYCSLPLTLQDAASNSLIKKQIFDLAQDPSQIPRHLLHQGKPLCISTSFLLNDKGDNQYKMGDFKDQLNSINSKTLEKRFLFLRSQDKKEQKKAMQSRLIIKERKSQLRLLARKIRQRSYRESVAEPVKSLSARIKSIHTSPPLTPGTDDAQEVSQQTLREYPRRFTSTSLCKPITNEFPKDIKEDGRSSQKRIRKTMPESPRRIPSIRNYSMRQTKHKKKRKQHHRKPQEQNQRELVFSTTRNDVLHKRVAEENDANKQDEDWGNVQGESHQAWPQLKNDEAQRNPDENSSLKEEQIPQLFPESPRRLAPIRNSASAEDKTDELQKKRKEHHRKPQEQNQRELVVYPTRNSVLHKRVAEEDDPNKQDEDWGNVQEESHQSWPQLKNDEAQRNPDENSSLKEEQIPQPLPESMRRLPPTRNSASAEDKTDELQKKRKEHHRKPQEQNQRELVFSPTRNSVPHKRVAEEDDPNKQDEDWGNVQEESHQSWPQLKNDEAQRNPDENSSLKEEQIPQPLPESMRRLPPTRNSASAEDKTDELQKKRKEHHRKPQEQNQRELVFSPTRNSVPHKRVAEEDDPNKQDEDWGNVQEESHQSWPQLKNDEAQRNPDENSSLKEEQIPQPLPESMRRLPPTRNSASAEDKTDELQKKRKEHHRKPQEQNQRELVFSPTRNSVPHKRVAEEDDPNKQDEDWSNVQEESHQSWPQLKNDEAQRNPEENSSLKEEQIPQLLPESPRRLPPTRNSASAEDKTDELQKKRKEHHCKPQEQNQRELVFSPIRNSVLHKRVAEEDDPNKQDEDWGNVQEESHQAWPRVKNDETKMNPEENSSLKKTRIPQPLPKSPRRLPHIRNTALAQGKTDELRKKREEDRRKQQERNQRVLAFSPTRNIDLRKRVAQEAAPNKQEKSLPTMLEFPRRLPFMRSTALRKLKAKEVSRKSAEDDRPKQEVTQQTWPESPRRLSSVRNSAMRQTVTDELDEEREEERCKQQSALSQSQSNEVQRNPEEDSGLTEEQIPKPLSKSPRRLPSARSLPMRHIKIKKKQKEDKSKPQEQNQRALVCPPIRNSLLHKRVAEDDPKKQVEELRSKKEKSIQALFESPRRLPFMRSTALRKLKAYAVSRKSAEDDRPKQEVTQQTWPESPRRLSSVRNSAMRQTVTDEFDEEREEERCKQQSALSQSQSNEVQRNPEEDSGLTEEQIPKPLSKSPRRLPSARSLPMRHIKIKKKQKEDKSKPQEQNQRALVCPPIRNSLLHKRVAEDDPKKQVEELRSKQEKSIQALFESPRRLPFMRSTALRKLKAYAVSRKSAEDDRPKQEVTQQTWPESPRRLSSIRNPAMRQSKTDELEKKRDEGSSKQQSPLSQCKTDEARDVDSRSTQERIPNAFPESPRRLPFMRTSVLHKPKANEVTKNRAEDGRPRQEEREQTMRISESPRRLSAIKRQSAVRQLQADESQEGPEEVSRLKKEQIPQPLPESPRRLPSVRQTKPKRKELIQRACTLHSARKSDLRKQLSEKAVRDRRDEDWPKEQVRNNITLHALPNQQDKQIPDNARNTPKDTRSTLQMRIHPTLKKNRSLMSKAWKAKTRAEPDKTEVVSLISPVNLVDSVGHVPTLFPGIECPNSIFQTSSTSFCRLYKPVKIPAEFSPAACLHLKGKLRNLNINRAFSKFVNLVNAINSTANPLVDHLLFFFQFAEFIDLKMYARKILYRSRSSSTEEAEPLRFQIECYVFEDRRDYVTSISMASEPLLRIREAIPGVERRLKLIDDVFELTNVPPIIAKCLKMALNAVDAAPLYHIIGEVLYAMKYPEESLIQLNCTP
ncbi:titin [Drosophila persimilis]|uniref:titin n=1 Tax=Drosophila persimilis TaxID=7234 RepID=UPI000F082E18|nr:titin [Drosophila persimilis]